MDPVALLKDLVRIPSVNPMGRELTGPEFLEARLTEFLVDLFGRLRIDCARVEVAPGEFELVDRHWADIVSRLASLGFDAVERDARGYRRGSLLVLAG